ncbi:MAG TPA: sigma-70 family RNA polymerase sigma factor [Polyangiaceae bacterium]
MHTGEEQRFAALYREFWPIVYRRCRRLLSADQLAEDATQEIFLKVMAHQAELPPGEETSRWISRVTSNYCFNYLRDEKRRLDARLDLKREPAPFTDGVADRDLVRRVIASVPEDVGLVGWLNHVDELDQRDIAARLNISRRTVVTRLSTFNARARRVLRSL